MSYVFRTMIVSAATAPLARALCSQLSGAPGENMFMAALSSTGAAPATNYVSTGMIDESFGTLLTDAAAMFSACQQAGASVTLEQCQTLVAQSDVGEQLPSDAFGRLGLHLIDINAEG